MKTIKKECSVIMLDTEEPTKIGVCIKKMSDRNIGDIQYFESSMLMSLEYWKPQHIYIVYNSNIKVEDWVIDNDSELKYIYSVNTKTGVARHIDDTPFILDDCKKIIATNYKSLTIDLGHTCLDTLPQIPQSFIKQYCEEGGIGVVNVEYFHHKLLNHEYPNKSNKEYHDEYRLKLNSNNEVIISSIKENTYSREDIQVLIKDFIRFYINRPVNSKTLGGVGNWIKENL